MRVLSVLNRSEIASSTAGKNRYEKTPLFSYLDRIYKLSVPCVTCSMIAPPERPNTSMSGQLQAGPTGYGQSSGAHSTSAYGCEFNWWLQHMHEISLLVFRILMFFSGVRSTAEPLYSAGLAYTWINRFLLASTA